MDIIKNKMEKVLEELGFEIYVILADSKFYRKQ